MNRLTLKGKILLWLGIIILVSIILYGFLIYMVYQFNLRGERYYYAMLEMKLKMAENAELFDESLIEELKEFRKEDFQKPAIPLIIPKGLFIQVFLLITGGVIAIIIISVVGGFLLLRRMLNQVDLITRNVKDIDEKGLHLRLKLKGRDPISNMANTFDSMLDKIESAFRSQRQFIQNASHELNTPLTVIKTKIDVLKQKKSITGKQYMETIDLVDSEIMRLSKITEELLILSDLEDNSYQAVGSIINMRGSLKRILKLYENQIDSKNLILETSFEGKSEVHGNPVQVEQLLFNLLDNAVKFSDPGGHLRINVKNDRLKKKILLNIINTTSAINKEDIPHIFERFYRSSSSGGRKNFGLGLSIAKKIVEKHSGEIDTSFDQDKKEVTFMIKLPIAGEK
ncbi:MAG: HAMP domain-containing histidine kinase [Actinobacteria bacterium]|nr:HAMP domain-containing histidine kinase [Actinomycetota bacterium]